MDSILKPQVSRRTFLRVGALTGGGAILGLGSAADAAASKVAKGTVDYQASPKGQAHCSNCAFFQAPSSCNYVNGPIIPSGWCVLYKAKG